MTNSKNVVEQIILSLEKKVERTSNDMVSVQNATQHTIQTAHNAFGGHISKGLLKRGRSALDKRNAAFLKLSRTKVILELAILARQGSPYKVGCNTTYFWSRLTEIVSKFHLLKDFGDSTDYYMADRSGFLYEKMEATKSFISRYAGKREMKLSEILFAKP